MRTTKEPAAIKRYTQMKHNLVNIILALSALTVILLAMSWPVGATTVYSLTDLGTLSDLGDAAGYTYSNATGINNSGQVVGIGNVGRSLNGFRTAPQSPINRATDNLGTLGGLSPRGPYAFATGINNSGQVVGFSFIPPPPGANLQEDAFRTAPNSPINPATDDLGVLGSTSPLTASSFAYGINNSGQVVGSSSTALGETHAFRTAPQSPINPATDDLGTLGGTSSNATGINKSGQVVGSSTTANGQTHAFRTAPNRLINPATDDLGTLGGTSSGASGINKSGQVVGSSTTAHGETHAFLYDVSGHLIDLNSLINPDSRSDFSVLTAATAINDRGQIVGYGSTTNGTTRAFFATPITQSSSKK